MRNGCLAKIIPTEKFENPFSFISSCLKNSSAKSIGMFWIASSIVLFFLYVCVLKISSLSGLDIAAPITDVTTPTIVNGVTAETMAPANEAVSPKIVLIFGFSVFNIFELPVFSSFSCFSQIYIISLLIFFSSDIFILLF